MSDEVEDNKTKCDELIDDLKAREEARQEQERQKLEFMHPGYTSIPPGIDDHKALELLFYYHLAVEKDFSFEKLFEIERRGIKERKKLDAEEQRKREEYLKQIEEDRKKTIEGYWPSVNPFIATWTSANRKLEFDRDKALVKWTCDTCDKTHKILLFELKLNTGGYGLEEILNQGIVYDFKCMHPDHKKKNIKSRENCLVALWIDKEAVFENRRNPDKPIVLTNRPPEELMRIIRQPRIYTYGTS